MAVTWGILLGILGKGVPPSSLNPDPISARSKRACHPPQPFSDLVSKIHVRTSLSCRTEDIVLNCKSKLKFKNIRIYAFMAFYTRVQIFIPKQLYIREYPPVRLK